MTPATADLSDLLRRVKEATGADREIDCALACSLDGFFPAIKPWPIIGGSMTWALDFCCWRYGGLNSPGHGGHQLVPRYSASLDAALALVGRLLPGWLWEIGCATPPGHWARLSEDFIDMAEVARAKTPALAILAALLTALTTEREDG